MFYYLNPENKPIGPISAGELQRLFLDGQITDATKVAREGSSSWNTYRELALSQVPLDVMPPVPGGRSAELRAPKAAGWLSRVRVAPFLALFIILALPFLEVSCHGTKFVEISGYNAVTGFVVRDPTGMSNEARHTPGSLMMRVIAGLGLAGTICAASRARSLRISAAGCGIVGAILTVFFGVTGAAEINGQGQGLTASFGSGFYLTVLCFGLAGYLNWRGHDAILAAAPSPKSSLPAGKRSSLKISWRPTRRQKLWSGVIAIAIAAIIWAPSVYDAAFNSSPSSAAVKQHASNLIAKLKSDQPLLSLISTATKETARDSLGIHYEVTATFETSQPLYSWLDSAENSLPESLRAAVTAADAANRALPDELSVKRPSESALRLVRMMTPRGKQVDLQVTFAAKKINRRWQFDDEAGTASAKVNAMLLGKPLNEFGGALITGSTEAAEAGKQAVEASKAYIASVTEAHKKLDERIAEQKAEEERKRSEKLSYFAEGASFNGIARQGDTRIDEVYLVITSNRFSGKSVTANLYHAVHPDRFRQLKGRVDLDPNSQVPVIFLEFIGERMANDPRFENSVGIFQYAETFQLKGTATGNVLFAKGSDLVLELERMPTIYTPVVSGGRNSSLSGGGNRSSDAESQQTASSSSGGVQKPQYGGTMIRAGNGKVIEMFKAGSFPSGGTYVTPEQVKNYVGRSTENVWLTGNFTIVDVSPRAIRVTDFNPIGAVLGITGLMKAQTNYDLEFPQGVSDKFKPNRVVAIDSSQPLEVLSVKKMPDGKILVNTRVRLIDP